MNHITFRISIALLTFIVGVAAVSLWFFFRLDVDVKNESKQSPQFVADVALLNELLPKVKAIYISEPLELYGPKTTLYGSIVVFYENGNWGRLSNLLLSPIEKQLRVQFESGNVTEIGRWTENNGKIIVSIEGKYYSCLIQPPKEKIAYPVVEIWNIKRNEKGNSILLVGKEKYKQTSVDRFLEVDKIVESPFLVGRFKTTCCDCELPN